MDYRYGSHTVYKIEYHFVWVTKYRYKVLRVLPVSLHEIPPPARYRGAPVHAHPEVLPCPHPSPPLPPN